MQQTQGETAEARSRPTFGWHLFVRKDSEASGQGLPSLFLKPCAR